jgi:hypothetical protein
MPGDPKEFRENATRCLAMAAEAPDPDLRESLVETAHRWLRLATDIEGTDCLSQTSLDKASQRG